MRLHHLVLSTVQREPLHLEVGPRRRAVRTLARVGGARVPAFAFADDHLHALVDHDRPAFVGGRIATALRALPGAPTLQPAWTEPVADRAHLRRLVTYLLRQPEHHGLGHPAEWEGSCFLDLVGARVLDGFDAAAWRANLPREGLDLVWDAVRLDPPAGAPVEGQPLGTLFEAASRALGAEPPLLRDLPHVVRARHVAVALAVEAGFAVRVIAAALGVTERAVRRLAHDPCPEADHRAARRALAIAVAVTRHRLRAA